MTPNFVAVVSVLLPFVVILAGVCHFCAFFVEEIGPLLGAITDNWVVNTCLWSELED